jgi:predicted lactoylglutathione lyase
VLRDSVTNRILASNKKLSGMNLRVFVGAEDFKTSKLFYHDLGFQINWERDDIIEFEISDSKFFLQNYYNKEWCENSMMHLTVDSASAWYDHSSRILRQKKYGRAKCSSPKREEYGAYVTHVWDPSGVLWHFAEYE